MLRDWRNTETGEARLMTRDWYCETGRAGRLRVTKPASPVSFHQSRFISLAFSVSPYQSRIISLALSVSMLALAFGWAPSATAQPCPELPGARKVESERYVLSFRTQPEQVAVSRHFAVEMAVCPKGGQPAPESVRVDGFMPEHNHGMNYRAVVTPAGDGRYDAAGLMFHMPGKWDFIFEIRSAGKTDRLTSTVVLH